MVVAVWYRALRSTQTYHHHHHRTTTTTTTTTTKAVPLTRALRTVTTHPLPVAEVGRVHHLAVPREQPQPAAPPRLLPRPQQLQQHAVGRLLRGHHLWQVVHLYGCISSLLCTCACTRMHMRMHTHAHAHHMHAHAHANVSRRTPPHNSALARLLADEGWSIRWA